MKQKIFTVLLLTAVLLPGFSSEKNIRSCGSFNFQPAAIGSNGPMLDTELYRSSGGDFSKLVPHKMKFFYSACAVSIAAGVFMTTGIVTSAIAGAFINTAYNAAAGHIAAIILSGTSWGIFFCLAGPAAAALWVLYGLALRSERKGKTSAFKADREKLAVVFRL